MLKLTVLNRIEVIGLNDEELIQALHEAQTFFRESIIANHIINTAKLGNIDEFNINPFLIEYLASYLSGEISNENIARALIYPRVLSSSITTTFGTQIQFFL